MKLAVLIVAVAACGASDDTLLSASRIALEELASVHVRVYAEVGDVTVDEPPRGLTVTTRLGADGTELEIGASCKAAHGGDTTLPVHVTARDGRGATLMVHVLDNGTEACLAEIQVWDEPCDGATCDAACDATADHPAVDSVDTFTFVRDTSHRLCVRSTAVDAMQIDGVALDLAPASSAFEAHEPCDLAAPVQPCEPGPNMRAVVVHGQPWLVGPFTLDVSASAGGLDFGHAIAVTIGDHDELGIETVATNTATEFTRTAVDLRVHHYPTTAGTCELSVDDSSSPSFLMRLANDGGDVTEPRKAGLSCDDAHPHYVLSFVPGIDAPADSTVTLDAYGTKSALDFKVASQADDLGDCTSWVGPAKLSLACADVDENGTLDVIRARGVGSACLTTVAEWRSGASVNLTTGGSIGQVLAIPTSPPTIWGITSNTPMPSLRRFDSATQQWVQPFGAPIAVGSDIVPLRRAATSGPPDTLATLLTGGTPTVRFIAIDDAELGSFADATLPLASPLAIGVIRHTVGSSEVPLLVAVGSGAPTYPIAVYSLTASLGMVKTATLTPLGNANAVHDMPSNATVSIVGRGNASPYQDIIVLFYASEFASAVTEAQFDGTSISFVTDGQYGGVGSIADTSEGAVLLGAASGALLSDGHGINASYTPWDPVPPTQPSSSYGRGIAPCIDKGGNMVGFVERSATGVRAIARDISVELP
jgi:hypothetical protein